MRSLLDSHAFLGWLEGSDNISEAARSVLRIRESEIFVSLACVRESTLKTVLEKWALPSAISHYIMQDPEASERNYNDCRHFSSSDLTSPLFFRTLAQCITEHGHLT